MYTGNKNTNKKKRLPPATKQIARDETAIAGGKMTLPGADRGRVSNNRARAVRTMNTVPRACGAPSGTDAA